jgi:Mn2+/Fe2+ NRAMP family transporter
VIEAGVIIGASHRYFPNKARAPLLRKTERARLREINMHKTIVTLLGSALIVASATQIAAAAQPHRSHKADRAAAMTHEQFRDANAALWPAPSSDVWRYSTGALSAPAGR